MTNQLQCSIGQYSSAGRKPVNQDFHGAWVPQEPQLSTKGVALALADGISSSEVSQEASEVAVTGFLGDYFSTPEAWSVRKSAHRVISATNSWLHAHTQRSQYRFDKDRGYVCTLSALIIKSTTAHLFHVGDARIFRLAGDALEQLTNDHRVWVSPEQSYLGRALGMDAHLEIDYRAFALEVGDVFVLTTDGVYEFASEEFIAAAIAEHAEDLDRAARAIVDEALAQGSDDNLTVQIVRIEALPGEAADEFYAKLTELPFPPLLEARMRLDGYRIVRPLKITSRSHVYLAVDEASDETVVLKAPSVDLRDDPAYLERFLLEEWIARRIDNPHVLRPCAQTRRRNYFYIATEYIDGQTLAQWMIDNPRPGLETVRGIVEQIAKGLRAFHRLEMLHQDLRPNNIMIDATGTVKIIDFGSTRVAGLIDTAPAADPGILGTAQYTAPEYFLGERGSERSDLFSLGVISYQLLTGRLPYGAQVARTRSRAAQLKLHYRPARDPERWPDWIDAVLRKAVHPDPARRHEDLSEFLYELRHPKPGYLSQARPPLLERNPARFWQGVSFLLLVVIVVLLILD